jgi:hypothetical protein
MLRTGARAKLRGHVLVRFHHLRHVLAIELGSRQCGQPIDQLLPLHVQRRGHLQVHLRCGVGQRLAGLGMVPDHHLPEGLDVRTHAALRGDFPQTHFCHARDAQLFDERRRIQRRRLVRRRLAGRFAAGALIARIVLSALSQGRPGTDCHRQHACRDCLLHRPSSFFDTARTRSARKARS